MKSFYFKEEGIRYPLLKKRGNCTTVNKGDINLSESTSFNRIVILYYTGKTVPIFS